MGPCNSVCSKRRNSTQPVTDKTSNKPTTLNKPAVEKKLNTKAIIENVTKELIIRSISEINGDAIKIEKCTDSTIIIMDYSAQVQINECKNCTIFIAPCKGSIYLNKSDNIKIICASGQFRCRDVTNSKISLFSASRPAIEQVKDFHLSCFCFMYTELPDLFSKAELNIWDNCWSEYVNFGKVQQNPSNAIQYFEVKSDEKFLEEFTHALKDQEISLDQYYPIPYTAGMSHIINKEYNHMLLLFKESLLDNLKLTDFLKMENLNDLNIKLIKTCTLEKGKSFLTDLENALKKNKNFVKSQFFGPTQNNYSSNGANGGAFANLNSNPRDSGMNKIESYIILWFVTDDYNFDTFKGYLDNQFDNFLCLVKNDFEEEGAHSNDPAETGNKILKDFIRMLFKDYDI